MKYDLAVIIPGRNEEFMSRTVKGVLENKRGNTEVIVGLDETWADPPIEDHKDLTMIHYSESIGQRAIVNRCVELTSAKYVMKLDAHSIVSEGFDLALLEAFNKLGNNIIQIPILYNLHAFDRVCPKCKHRLYQGPEPIDCEKCGTTMIREMVWKPRWSRKSEFYRFDTTLHFQYHSARKKVVPKEEPYPETMSAQGSCFVVSKEKYIELNLGDEEFGSWGSQGSQIACSIWLSGGRLVTNRNCWYSHMFRTQGQSFGFPYPQSGRQVEHSRVRLRKLFLDNTWDKQIYPLSWLIEKFKPAPDWHDESGKKVLDEVNRKGKEFSTTFNVKTNVVPPKAIITYTDNTLDSSLAIPCQKQMMKANIPIYNVSLKPMDFGTNIVLPLERGYLTLFKQIVAGLEACKEDIVFMCDHDLLYHPSHFDFIPPKKDVFYYDLNVWRVRLTDGYAIHYDAKQSNMFCGYRELVLDNYRRRVKWVEKNGWSTILGFEPGTQKRVPEFNNDRSEIWWSKYSSLDIRHGKNLTRSRWKPSDFRNGIRSCPNWKESDTVDGWGQLLGNMDKLLSSI